MDLQSSTLITCTPSKFPSITFDMDQYRLTSDSYKALAVIGSYLLDKNEDRVIVYGYISTELERNYALFLLNKRVEQVVTYLHLQYGIYRERLLFRYKDSSTIQEGIKKRGLFFGLASEEDTNQWLDSKGRKESS